MPTPRPLPERQPAANPPLHGLDWWRDRMQRVADESGESWLLLEGFCHQGSSRDVASSMTLTHGVRRAVATPQEIAQMVEEFHPRTEARDGGAE